MANLRKARKRRRLKRKLLTMVLFAILPVMLITSGYFYFFDTNLKADYYFNKAQKLDNASQYGSREAIKYYQNAITIYEAKNNRGAAVNAYIYLGLLHHKFGNIMQVERMVLNAIKIGGDDIPKPLKAKAYMLLASTVEPQKAKDYIKQALEIAEELDLKVLAIKSYYILARIYEYSAEFTEAEKVYLKAIQVADTLSSKDGFFDIEPLYANLAEIYAGEGSVTEAISYYEKAREVASRNSGHGVAIANYFKILGDLYKENMQMSKACEQWNRSKQEYMLMGKQPPMSVMQMSASESCQANTAKKPDSISQALQNG